MSEPFLAEVRPFAFNFAPRGWASCDGQILPINQNQALYSLLGTIYGGDGRVTFALPDLRGRTPVHVGSSGAGSPVQLGQRGGEESHVLTVQEMPAHTHTAQATSATPASTAQGGALLAPTGGGRRPLTPYGGASATLVPLHTASIGSTGGQAHNNMQPYVVINFCIALQGIFPSRN